MKDIDINVKKRNGKLQPFDAAKIHNHIEAACNGLADVFPGEIISFFKLKLTDKMKTSDIQQALILAAADLIDEEHPNYQYVAARFVLQDIRKRIYNKKNLGPSADGWTPRFNYNILKKRIEKGYYDSAILDLFTKDEINRILDYINWDNDFRFTYSGITQMLKKYLIKRNGEIIETPQEAFMLIPMYIFGQLPRDLSIDEMVELYSDAQESTEAVSLDLIIDLLNRFKDKGYANFREALIVEFYNALSNFEIFLSTPPMIGIRSTVRGVTSCAGINTGDSIESLSNATKSMLKLITNLRAGIGENDGYIRGAGADINNGAETHTGITPYVKLYEDISVSSQQPASGRSGQSTHYYPWFHWEIEDILVLKNNRGYDEKRARRNDHAIVFNKLFYKKLIDELVNGKTNTVALFHMNTVDDLYDEIGNDEYFEEKYNKLVNDDTVEKRWVSAKMIWNTFWEERYGTSRIYKVNADEFQQHSAFDIPVNFSNLCLKGDTKIITRDGVKEIKDIKVGDYVKSYNTESGETEFKRVTAQAMTSPKANVLKITDKESGKHIICTPDHEIWTENRGYVRAKDLKSDDILKIENQNSNKIEIEYLEEEVPVYDITVDGNHNFFANDILVHNCTEINLPAFPDEDHTIYVENVESFEKWFSETRDAGTWIDIYKFINYKKGSVEEALRDLYIRHPETVEEFYKRAALSKTEQFDKEYKINFGEIFSCILGGINFGNYGPDKEYPEKAELMFKNIFLLNWFLDHMIDYQDYVNIKPFEKFTKERRALGISPGNLYYLLAQYNADYDSQRARNIVDNTMEIMSFTGILSSVTLAMYRGKCKLFNDTKYSKGVFPVDTYNENVDELVTVDSLLKTHWGELKYLVKYYGMRNSTLFTAVPSSNSSRPGNMISGINPPQGLSYVVKDKKVSVTVLTPEVDKYSEFYKRNLAWDHDNLEYWKLIAVFQKWIDQAISLNQYVDYTKYENESVPESEVLETDLFTTKYGIKTLYYIKSKTGDEDTFGEKADAEVEGCSGGGCSL